MNINIGPRTLSLPKCRIGLTCLKTSNVSFPKRGLAIGQAAQFQTQGNAANKKVLTGSCVVEIEGKQLLTTPMMPSSNHNASLQQYMEHAAEHFSNMPLPLGGKLTRVDSSSMMVVTPKIELFDLWLQPRATAGINVTQNHLAVTCQTDDCVLDGSQHVLDLKLDDRYNLDVRIVINWTNNQMMSTDGSIKVEMDIPAPFSFIPKAVLKTVGNTAMNVTLGLIMSTFLDRLSKDYGQWASQVPK